MALQVYQSDRRIKNLDKSGAVKVVLIQYLIANNM